MPIRCCVGGGNKKSHFVIPIHIFVTSFMNDPVEDVFEATTLKLLRNGEEFEIKELKSFIYGICYSICKIK